MTRYAIKFVIQADIREIGILVNPETEDEIKKALGSGDKWGVRFTYILQEASLGLRI